MCDIVLQYAFSAKYTMGKFSSFLLLLLLLLFVCATFVNSIETKQFTLTKNSMMRFEHKAKYLVRTHYFEIHDFFFNHSAVDPIERHVDGNSFFLTMSNE